MGIPRPTGSPTTKRQRRPRQDGGVGRDARPSDVRGVDEERPDHLTLSLGGARRPGRRRNTGGHRRELELQRAGRAQRERGEDPAEHHDFVMAPDAGIQSFLRVLDVDAGPPPPLPPYFLSMLAHDVPNLQTSMPPGSVRDLMSALASNAGVPQDAQDANANTNPFLRVLREAERVMGGPPADEEEERQQRTGRPGRPGRSEQTRQLESPRRVTFRPPPDNDNDNNNNNTERTETIPAVVAELASNAAMRIQCLVRWVSNSTVRPRALTLSLALRASLVLQVGHASGRGAEGVSGRGESDQADCGDTVGDSFRVFRRRQQRQRRQPQSARHVAGRDGEHADPDAHRPPRMEGERGTGRRCGRSHAAEFPQGDRGRRPGGDAAVHPSHAPPDLPSGRGRRDCLARGVPARSGGRGPVVIGGCSSRPTCARSLSRSLALSLALSRTFDALRARSFARIWDTPRTRAAWTARHRWPTPRAVALPTWSLCSACERLTASIWSTSTAMGHCTMPQGASMAM